MWSQGGCGRLGVASLYVLWEVRIWRFPSGDRTKVNVSVPIYTFIQYQCNVLFVWENKRFLTFKYEWTVQPWTSTQSHLRLCHSWLSREVYQSPICVTHCYHASRQQPLKEQIRLGSSSLITLPVVHMYHWLGHISEECCCPYMWLILHSSRFKQKLSSPVTKNTQVRSDGPTCSYMYNQVLHVATDTPAFDEKCESTGSASSLLQAMTRSVCNLKVKFLSVVNNCLDYWIWEENSTTSPAATKE